MRNDEKQSGLPSKRLRAFQVENQREALIDLPHEPGWKDGDALRQVRLVNGQYLRDISDRWPGKAGIVWMNQHIPRSFGESQIRGDGNNNHGVDAAAVETIDLHNNDGAPVSWAGSSGILEGRPPDLAAIHHHSSFGSEERCINSRSRSTLDDSDP